MRNNLFYSAVILLSACAFSACSDDDKGSEMASVPAVIQGKIYTYDINAEAEKWKNNQMIGVTMLKSNSTELVEPYHNILYKTTVYPIGYFSPVTTDDVLNYPQDGSKVDIVAYYPYKDNLKSDLYPINVADQTQTKNFDILYANNSKGLSKDNKKTTIELRPVMSGMVIKLLPGDGVTKEYLANPSVVVNGMYTKGDFNILNGSFEESSMADINGITLPVVEGDGVTVSGILFPRTSTQGCRVQMTFPKMGRTYTWDLKELPQMEPGVRYTGQMEISLEKIEVKLVAESPITDWEDNETVTGGGSKFAPEFIKTRLEDLPLGAWTSSLLDVMDKAVEVNTWFFHVDANKKMTAEIKEDMDGNQSCKVVYSTVDPDAVSPVSQYIAYRTPALEPAIYTLSFRAKGTSSGSVRCYVKTGNKSMFVGAKPNSDITKPYNGYVLLNGLKADVYQDYSFDFDCSHTVPSTYSYDETQRGEATPSDLAKCAISFGANSKGQEFSIYQVSFKRKLNN